MAAAGCQMGVGGGGGKERKAYERSCFIASDFSKREAEEEGCRVFPPTTSPAATICPQQPHR